MFAVLGILAIALAVYFAQRPLPLQADLDVTAAVADAREGWLTSTLRILTWLGSRFVLFPVVAVAATLLVIRRRAWTQALELAAALAAVTLFAEVMRFLVARPRPGAPLATFRGSAFPSGHMANAVAVYLMIVVVLSLPRIGRIVGGALASLLALVVGFSRIYLGVHWLTDVVGGALVGGAVVALVVAVERAVARAGAATPPRGSP